MLWTDHVSLQNSSKCALSPQRDDVWRRRLWEVIRSWGWSPHKWISALRGRDPDFCSSQSCSLGQNSSGSQLWGNKRCRSVPASKPPPPSKPHGPPVGQPRGKPGGKALVPGPGLPLCPGESTGSGWAERSRWGRRAMCPASSDRRLRFKNPSTFTECGLPGKESAHSQRRPQTNPSPSISLPHPCHPGRLARLSPLPGLDLGWKPRALRRPPWASRAKGKAGAPRPVQGAGSALSAVTVTTVIKPTQSQLSVAGKATVSLSRMFPLQQSFCSTRTKHGWGKGWILVSHACFKSVHF